MPEVAREKSDQIACLRGLRPALPRKPLGDIVHRERWK
jgi:hypothetical protein